LIKLLPFDNEKSEREKKRQGKQKERRGLTEEEVTVHVCVLHSFM